MEINTNLNLESRSIPGEHTNQTPISFQQIGHDEDYFVYKLDPNDEKWARWDVFDKDVYSRQDYLGLQISDTVKNSYIHVFPDRQDLVNPAVFSHFKYEKEFDQHHYFMENLNRMKDRDYELKSPRVEDNHPKNDKNKIISKVLPTSILEDSLRDEITPNTHFNKMYEMNIEKPGKNLKNPFINSEYQSYSKGIPKDSDFLGEEEVKENLEDFSEIIKSKALETIPLDESDDMSFAVVIKTLEKNISRSKAIRKYLKSNDKKVSELKVGKIGSGKKYDDTLSLEQSSGVSNISTIRNPLYEQPNDLRTRFLLGPPEGNNTVYYSFAADNQESFAKNSEKNYNNFSKNYNKNSNLQDEKDPLKIKESEFKKSLFSPNKTHNIKKSPKLELVKIEEEISGIKTPFQQKLNALINSTKEEKVVSQEQKQNLKGKPPLPPKTQPSDNYILCINCNDLLPAGSVDIHSIYCNENMLAQEDPSKALVIEPEDILSSLERCNLRLQELKVLLEKNIRNLKGQISLGLIQANETDIIFSDMILILQIIEEVIRNKKVPYKLYIDTRSITNLKDDLSLFIDITLVAVMISNLEIVLKACQQKKFVVELIQKQDYFLNSPLNFEKDTNESFLNNPIKKPFAPKYDLEKLRFSSLTSPQSTSSNPISHSHKPSFPTSVTQSTRGSTGYSRRMPLDNRFLLGSDTKNL